MSFSSAFGGGLGAGAAGAVSPHLGALLGPARLDAESLHARYSSAEAEIAADRRALRGLPWLPFVVGVGAGVFIVMALSESRAKKARPPPT